MPHFLRSITPVRESPTLWPLRPDDMTAIECAVEACEAENRALKSLVISLSEIILKAVVSRK